MSDNYVTKCYWRWLPRPLHLWVHLRCVPRRLRWVFAPPCELTVADQAWLRDARLATTTAAPCPSRTRSAAVERDLAGISPTRGGRATATVSASAYEVCPSCKGAGMENGLHEPVTCTTCHGDCMVRRRDAQGRFTVSTDCEDVCLDECQGACGVL